MIYNESELIETINNKNIENFEKNGGIDMYVYKTSKEEEKTLKDSVLEKLKEVDNKYEMEDYVAPELQTLELEDMEYTSPTDDEIHNKAIESLQNYKDSELLSLEDKYDAKFANVSESALKALENKEEDETDILSDYGSSLKKAKNSNIKRGLSHSSIMEKALKAIEGEKEVRQSEVEQEYVKKISKLENEKSILEQQKESALTSFDISYATKLQSKIASINSEIAKEQAAVEKYNQANEKQEEAYIKEQEKAIAAEQKTVDARNKALQNLIDKKGVTEVNRMKTQEKYEIVYNYLSSLSKVDALKELQSESTYKDTLGNFYTLLYAQISKRKD